MADEQQFGRDAAQRVVRQRLEQVVLRRDCEVVRIPEGDRVALEAETEVTILQQSDGAFTIQVPTLGVTCRVDAEDSDTLGKNLAAHDGAEDGNGVAARGGSLDQQIDAQLRRVYDPELPVNIVDLGLVYDVRVWELSAASFRVEIDMTLTTQACGMGAIIAREAKQRVLDLARVEEAEITIVWEPPWAPQRISEAGRKKLGIG
jgi:probable FeS assembly SUF system protein SufT